MRKSCQTQEFNQMILRQKRYAVGVFFSYIDAESAPGELKRTGFPLAQISIVAKTADHDAQLDSAGVSDCVGEEAETATGAIVGSMLGAILGCLAGLGMLAVPGVGFIIVAVGTTGTSLATATLAGAGIGAASGGLISAIAGSELSSDQARVAGGGGQSEFLVMVEGADDEVRQAESILNRSYSSKVWVC